MRLLIFTEEGTMRVPGTVYHYLNCSIMVFIGGTLKPDYSSLRAVGYGRDWKQIHINREYLTT